MAGKIVLLGEPMGLFIANEPGELSKVNTFTSAIAGAEYNVAVGLSRMGHQAVYCTKLGTDSFGDKIVDAMQKNGISTDLVFRDASRSTGFMMKGKVEKGDPKIQYYRKNSAASSISAEDVTHLDLSGCTWLHVTGIMPAVSESALFAVKRLIARALALNITISFDPNLRPQLWESEKKMIATLNELAEQANLILPGLKEGAILTGKDSAEDIADYYHAKGVRYVIVKLGKDGAYYSEQNGASGYSGEFPAEKIVDTVGAGDGFAAGVISALAEGLSLKEAAFRGNVFGAIQISHKSDNEGLPTREVLEKVIQRGTA
ncbi:sugar kinase [Scatolibacter rhodanostii]|uniref:sugar kinase n=1 Tax=Scatolibacter rhodanostii TaxID=2014781 RepID=UPI000C082014|nr:sugar kinase [Scatolibacter rhodanostii]